MVQWLPICNKYLLINRMTWNWFISRFCYIINRWDTLYLKKPFIQNLLAVSPETLHFGSWLFHWKIVTEIELILLWALMIFQSSNPSRPDYKSQSVLADEGLPWLLVISEEGIYKNLNLFLSPEISINLWSLSCFGVKMVISVYSDLNL